MKGRKNVPPEGTQNANKPIQVMRMTPQRRAMAQLQMPNAQQQMVMTQRSNQAKKPPVEKQMVFLEDLPMNSLQARIAFQKYKEMPATLDPKAKMMHATIAMNRYNVINQIPIAYHYKSEETAIEYWNNLQNYHNKSWTKNSSLFSSQIQVDVSKEALKRPSVIQIPLPKSSKTKEQNCASLTENVKNVAKQINTDKLFDVEIKHTLIANLFIMLNSIETNTNITYKNVETTVNAEFEQEQANRTAQNASENAESENAEPEAENNNDASASIESAPQQTNVNIPIQNNKRVLTNSNEMNNTLQQKDQNNKSQDSEKEKKSHHHHHHHHHDHSKNQPKTDEMQPPLKQ